MTPDRKMFGTCGVHSQPPKPLRYRPGCSARSSRLVASPRVRMTDLDTLLTALYVKIDDELKGIPRMGCPPRFTDAELVTVAVAQVLLGHESERGWIRAARKQIGHLFPYLPDQPGYN